MLPRQHRIALAGEFRTTMRSGRRRGGELLVTHARMTEAGEPARFGFVVSKAVGGAVQRNVVRRRLRALCAERITAGSVGIDVVVRALPASARATYGQLRTELDAQLGAAA